MTQILAAKVLKSHGLHGVLKVVAFLEDFPKYYKKLVDDRGNPLLLNSCVLLDATHNYYLIKVEGLHKVEDTLQYIGHQWFINDDQLAPTQDNNYYYYKLIGLPVVDENNNSVGVIEDMDNMGAGDIMIIKLNINTTVHLPFNIDMFPEVLEDKIIISKDGLDYIFEE
jgi:16S rRNA processing protein RimM